MRNRIIICLIIFALGLAHPARAASSEVRATIQPVRIITIDEQGQITAIHTNTHQEVLPMVEQKGRPYPFTPEIQHQYEAIWPILQLLQPIKF